MPADAEISTIGSRDRKIHLTRRPRGKTSDEDSGIRSSIATIRLCASTGAASTCYFAWKSSLSNFVDKMLALRDSADIFQRAV
jgi:hypothetical protein